MKQWQKLKIVFEYLEGCYDELSARAAILGVDPAVSPEPVLDAAQVKGAWFWRGLWWGLLAGAILLFSGQTSKFIYIDF